VKTFLENARKGEDLSPQQRAFTENILREYRDLYPERAAEIEQALKGFSELPQANFILDRRGEGTEAKKGKFSVFSANIICFPGELPYLYGGISPWKGRIDSIVKKILASQADLICLQEVWDPEAMRMLVDLLKGNYSYFVYEVGDPAGTLQVDRMGYNSGLFIASKLELEEIDFRLFKRSIPENSKRGMLSCVCRLGESRVAFITTHLQHGDEEEMKRVRKEQLLSCHARLDELIGKGANAWGFLAGDLNVDSFSKELEESRMGELFVLNRVLLPKEKAATATNYFTDLVRTPVDRRKDVAVSLELLDYCIRPASCLKRASSVQRRIPLFSVDAPSSALSDHHALLTTWSF
ncbi:MAG: endonuclease/exonuclease/phosphatase family protein, partial [Chlamydiales bacterium]|nr:endonuclease/exonuclease/phosphatase family protein [Chlamydiales bacterium]